MTAWIFLFRIITRTISIYRNKYVPGYVPPKERDFFSYLDQLKYEETLKNTDSYFQNVKVVNFELIHHKCRGDPLKKDTKEHFSIENKDFAEYPKNDKKK